MRLLIAHSQHLFQAGPYEALARRLQSALALAGHEAAEIRLPVSDDSPSEMKLALPLLDLSQAAEVPVDRLIALGGPLWGLGHPVRIAWVLDDTWTFRPPADPSRRLDCRWLGGCRRVFASHLDLALRLRRLAAVHATVLSPGRPDDDLVDALTRP
jgi:hypothetical protein